MKKSLLFFAFALVSICLLNAQQKMYVMENGVATEYDIATQVDSVIFYAPTPQPPAGTLKIALLGDSITHGAPNSTGYYRKPLYYLLRNAGFNFDYVGHRTDWGLPTGDDPDKDWDRDHSAQWGISSTSVASNLPSYLSKFATPDIVLIHLGTNDWGNGDSIRDAHRSMINTLRAANPKVVVFIAHLIKATPNYGLENTAGPLRIKIEALRAEMNTEQSPIIVVDMFTPFIVEQYLATDGLHPNTLGASKMAEWWFEAINTYYGLN